MRGDDGTAAVPDGWPGGAGLPTGDRRQQEIGRLLTLMGGSIAALYEDACRLSTARPPLATASHVVGHLAREIESALRELLTALVPPDRMAAVEALPRAPSQRGPSWKQVVDEICTALGFPGGDEVRSLWKSVLWAPRAHREALLRPRPVDEAFRSEWRDFEALLLRVGRQYEATYTATLPLVDQLAALDNPSKDDLGRLRNQVPHGVVALRRFFERAGAGWFTRLWKAGYLDDPPRLQPTTDGLVTYVPWPAGPYVARMAKVPSLADAVVNVVLGWDTDNPEACEAAADAALALPTDHSARLAPKLAAFLTQPAQWALPDKAGEVVVALAASGQIEAALVVMAPLLPAGTDRSPARRYVPRKALVTAFPDLGVPGLTLLTDRLTNLTTEDATGRGSLDHSYIWRPAVESDNHGDGRDVLISMLRDAAVAVATAGNSAAVLDLLDRQEPTLFARLTLHVLTRVPAPALVTQRLTTRELFDDTDAFREYTQLLRRQFATLPAESKQQILGFVDAGPPHTGPPEAVDRWRLRQLARFGDSLPASHQDLYEALIDRFGAPETDEHPFQAWEFADPAPPADAAALTAMTDNDLLTMLATWTPEPGWRAASEADLRTELENAVARDPARFAPLAPRFAELDPTYGRGLLAGLTKAVTRAPAVDTAGSSPAAETRPDETDEAHVFDWAPVLAFGRTILELPRLLPGRPPTGDGDRDPGWIWCRQQLADLLVRGLHADSVAAEDADTVLTLLTRLTEDPDPQPDDHSDGHDPAYAAINSVRGRAFSGLMHYALWKRRNRQPEQPAKLDYPVKAILEAHLDPDIEPTHAVRAVYGQYFGTLTVCDPTWARDHVDKIFEHREASQLGATAWNTYLRFSRPNQRTYDLLAPYYLASVTASSQQATPSTTPAETSPENVPDQIRDHLVHHLAALYGQGLVTLEHDSPIALFLSHAPLRPRAKFIEVLGIMLRKTDTPGPTVLRRLELLWEWRVGQLRTAPSSDLAEVAGFGWWFSAGKFDADWALTHLQALLATGGTVAPEDLVADQLAAYRTSHLDQAVQCLGLLIEAATTPWFTTASHDAIRAVLGDGLHASDATVRRRTLETTNRLIARGHVAFTDLLDE